MNPLDAGNALFEGVGAVLIWLNVGALWHDRVVRGVNPWVTVFWASWGAWNSAVYYPGLDQPMSWGAGVVLALGSASWLGLFLWLRLGENMDRTLGDFSRFDE